MQRTAVTAAAAALALGLIGCSQPEPPEPPEPEPTSQPPSAGPRNAITDVAGVHVGQVDRRRDGYLTGTTVVHLPRMSITGVDVAGGAPGTRETALLSPVESNPGANAIVLSGGSAYGLAAADGVMQELEKRGEGYPVGEDQVVPIVPSAILYDLGRGGKFEARPTADWGARALQHANSGTVAQGTVGAGTGAMTGGFKGGIGTASVTLDDGTTVGAIVAVNAAGSPVDPDDCFLLGADKLLPGELEGLTPPDPSECGESEGEGNDENPAGNTTIGLVASDASLSKAAVTRMAQVAQDGLARGIDPSHTLADGDTLFATATGQGEALEVHRRQDGQQLNRVYNASSDALTRAIVHAMVAADSAGGAESYCATYPSACPDNATSDSS